MIKLILIGLVAGAFFSSTFVLNELMSVSGGHWFWSASLRYVFMFILLSGLIVARHGFSQLTALARVFIRHWGFWCVAGGIGFGLFYAGICYAADHAAGWVVASTFMFTVVASLFVLAAFGQRFNKQVIIYALMIFAGVVMANISEAMHVSEQAEHGSNMTDALLFGALPALIAAFSYPIGNQLVWQASRNAKLAAASNAHAATHADSQTNSAPLPQSQLPQNQSWTRHIPTIKTDLLGDAFNKVWLLTVGSFPFWLILGAILHPSLPSGSQTFNTFLVALLSGVVATSVFLYAREQAQNSQEVAGVDATQASEVIFALLGGIILLGTPLPSLIGIGIALIMLGLVLFAKNG